MGLDMYAWTVLEAGATTDVDLPGSDDGPARDDLHYWRKHPDLHGWMERLYREKGGQDSSFNCNSVRLTTEDLDRLASDLDALPHTTGFFFGASEPEDKVGDLEFIAKARAAIAEGRAVYYDSWW